MDDDFAFALFEDTPEEWAAKQREWAEWEQKRAQRHVLDEAEKLVFAQEAEDDRVPSLWQRSYVRSLGDESPFLSLFGVGCHLAELIDDLRGGSAGQPPRGRAKIDRGMRDPSTIYITTQSQPDAQYWIDTLNRDFSNLRQAVASPSGALIEPVAARFTEHLLAVAESRADLRAKCLDLDRQLFDFTRRLIGNSDTPGDSDASGEVPF